MSQYLYVIRTGSGNLTVGACAFISSELSSMSKSDPGMRVRRVFAFDDPQKLDMILHRGQETRNMMFGWQLPNYEALDVDTFCELMGGRRMKIFERMNY